MQRLWQRISRTDSFWVGGQLLLFGWTATAGIRQLRHQGWPRPRTLAIGSVPLIAAISVAELARRELGSNLTMAPTPVDSGRLVSTGIYGRVRHPMYLSAIMALTSWAMVTKALVSIAAVPTAALFFSAKARHEEELLSTRYAGYAAYRQRVTGRIMPRTLRHRRAA